MTFKLTSDIDGLANASSPSELGRRTATSGAIVRETGNLSAEQVERILAYQREHQVRFGEAAVALGLVSANDVLLAASQPIRDPHAALKQHGVSPELVALNEPFSNQAEAFRAIRSQVLLRMQSESEQRRSIAVISPSDGDGKSFFTANLAVAFAQLGGRTLVVDADLRAPRQHEIFNIENAIGLSEILSGSKRGPVIQQVSSLSNLFVLSAGQIPLDALELLERRAFELLMRELDMKFDRVLVDTPAYIHGNDAAVIANCCAATLVVARKDISPVGSLQDIVASLGTTKVAGVVVNDFEGDGHRKVESSPASADRSRQLFDPSKALVEKAIRGLGADISEFDDVRVMIRDAVVGLFNSMAETLAASDRSVEYVMSDVHRFHEPVVRAILYRIPVSVYEASAFVTMLQQEIERAAGTGQLRADTWRIGVRAGGELVLLVDKKSKMSKQRRRTRARPVAFLE